MHRNCQTIEELAHGLVVGIEGLNPTGEEKSWLRQWQPAGVILFSRNVQSLGQLQELCSQLRGQVPGLQIMADHEGGPVSQMAAAVGRPPVAYALGALDDLELTRRVHEETGRRLLCAGLDWVLGPCADVLFEGRNPVIGARAFGTDPDLVSRQVAAAVEGFRRAGISCCLKHWPGHGSSKTDSHLESTVVRISPREELPFQAGLSAGADAVMPGHLKVDNGDWPATLSPKFLHETRAKLSGVGKHFLLLADDVSMGALREPMEKLGVPVPGGVNRDMVEVALLPVSWFSHLAQAGCDRFLIRGIPWGAFPGNGMEEASPTTSLDRRRHVFDEASYGEARTRILPRFAAAQEELFHLDLARQDRWQVAGGLGPEHWSQWDEILASRFAGVLRTDDLATPVPGDGLVSMLLVTHHRPMPDQWSHGVWGRSLKNRLAGSGRCVLMGHPSLRDDFQSFLGEGWGVTSLYDVSCEELIRI